MPKAKLLKEQPLDKILIEFYPGEHGYKNYIEKETLTITLKKITYTKEYYPQDTFEDYLCSYDAKRHKKQIDRWSYTSTTEQNLFLCSHIANEILNIKKNGKIISGCDLDFFTCSITFKNKEIIEYESWGNIRDVSRTLNDLLSGLLSLISIRTRFIETSFIKKKEYKRIEIGKLWHEYTEKERKILPRLPKSDIKNGKAPYVWNGYFWEPILND